MASFASAERPTRLSQAERSAEAAAAKPSSRRRWLTPSRADDGGEAQEGESVSERPDSPDDLDEAAGEGDSATLPSPSSDES